MSEFAEHFQILRLLDTIRLYEDFGRTMCTTFKGLSSVVNKVTGMLGNCRNERPILR